MYFLKLFIVFLSLQLLLFAQPEKLEKVKLQLQWKYQFQFAGFIMAKENGYYKEAGLDVDILEYNNTNSIKDLEGGKIDYALNNSILAYANKKLNKVTLIATYFQRSPLIIITQPNIKSVLDLKGKKVMISENNHYNSSLSVLLEYFNINSKNTTFVKPSFNIEDFIDKKVDAVTAFRSNELFVLDEKHVPYNIIDPVEYGFSTNAINLFASYDKIKNNPQQIRKFLAASKKGWQYALSHIEEVAKLIHDKYQPNRSVANLIYEGKVTKELMLLNLYDIGEVNKDFVLKRFKRLVKRGKIDKDQKSDKLFFDNEKKVMEPTVKFSQEEKEWITNHPVVTYSEVNWKPLSIIKNNKMTGIMGSFLDIISKRSGLKFKYVPSDSWPDVLKKFDERKIDIVPGVGSSPQEIALGNISKIYAQYPMAIVTGNDIRYVDNLNALKDKTIAVPKYYTSYNFIVKNYPDIKLITTDDIPEALLEVENKNADAFVGHIATSLYYLLELHLQHLKISGTTKFNFEHHYLVQKDNPILLSIINKTLDSITPQEKKEIYSKWVQTTRVEKTVDYTLLTIVSIFFIIIIILFWFWTKKLKQEISKRETAEKEYQDLYNNSSEMFISVDANTAKVVNCNDTLARKMGYTKDEIIGKEVFNFYHPESVEDVKREFKKFVKTGIVKNAELSVQRKDGSKIDILLNASAKRDKENNIIRSLSTWTDITERKESEKMLEHIAHYDTLTDLPNRVLLADRLHFAMAHAKRNSTNVIIAYLDLDGFKEINDMYGHDIGDYLLVNISKKMKSILREEDSIARLGGDEFVIVLNNFADVHASTQLIERLLSIVSKPISYKNLSLKVSASIGVTFFPQSQEIDADQLLRQADQAMYQAKVSGKNRYYIFNPDQDQSIRGHHENLDRIKQALENDEFILHYQPKVNLRTGSVVGLEALIRWQHPEKGLLSPFHFLPEIEGHHLDVEMGELVINKVLSQIQQWKNEGLDINASVNISATHIQQSDFTEKIQSFISKYPDLSPSNLELEILETTSIENMTHVSNVVTTLTEMGFEFSLDDFGTGYSSLTYLKRLPVQTLKIDQSFVRDMLDDPEDFAIIDGVIGLASAFNRTVLAEGMEHIEQAELLLRLGCELVQGYAIAKPMSPDDIPAWIENFSADPSWKNIEVVHQDKLPILYASIEHRAWIKSISNIINDHIEITLAMDKDKCRFGKWLYNHKDENKEVLKELKELHSQVHDFANDLMSLHKKGKDEEALSKLPDLYDLRDRLLARIELLLP